MMGHLEGEDRGGLRVGEIEDSTGKRVEHGVAGGATYASVIDRAAKEKLAILDGLIVDAHGDLHGWGSLVGNRKRHQERRFGGDFAHGLLIGDSVMIQIESGIECAGMA